MGERKLPPRVYCDICEEFDLHETEDCPQQASEDLPPSHFDQKEKKEKKKVPERPYCDTCEGKMTSYESFALICMNKSLYLFVAVFGHATEDCDEDQTF